MPFHDRLASTVAVVVPSPATSEVFEAILHHLAPCSRNCLQLDFLGDRHAVLGHGGRTEGSAPTHCALGAEGHLTGRRG